MTDLPSATDLPSVSVSDALRAVEAGGKLWWFFRAKLCPIFCFFFLGVKLCPENGGHGRMLVSVSDALREWGRVENCGGSLGQNYAQIFVFSF